MKDSLLRQSKKSFLKMEMNLEGSQTWQHVFGILQDTELHETYRHVWTLQINNTLDELTFSQRQQGWKIYKTSTFASFRCPSCRNFWNSAKVSLTFHYRLVEHKRGEVRLRLFRQVCRSCKNDIMLTGSFARDKKEEVLMRLINKIKRNCYKEDIDIVDYFREMKITKPHEASLCEACKMGKCSREEELF
uniref:3CxxC-type domain-containing protein n=1 Tax=Leptobrachium leishanense TaxID=445787 RepID=A0A8C5MP11_9ANUR